MPFYTLRACLNIRYPSQTPESSKRTEHIDWPDPKYVCIKKTQLNLGLTQMGERGRAQHFASEQTRIHMIRPMNAETYSNIAQMPDLRIPIAKGTVFQHSKERRGEGGSDVPSRRRARRRRAAAARWGSWRRACEGSSESC